MAFKKIGVAAHRQQRGEIRVDREPGVGGVDRLVRAVGIIQVDAFHVIRPQGIGRDRNRPVSRTEDFLVVVGLVVSQRGILICVSVSFASQRVGIVWVDLQRLLEQGARRLVFFLPPMPTCPLPRQGPPAHGEINGVGVLGTGALFRFRLDEFDA